jgi:hypothetical protein
MPTRNFIMSRIAKTVFACVVAAGLAGAAVAAPAPGTAKLTPAEKTALKQAISSCKSEAKGKKVPWLQRRKYVKGCVVEALKDKPNIDVMTLLKTHPDMKDLPAESADAM